MQCSQSHWFLPVDEKYSVNVFSFSKQVYSHHRIGSKKNLGYADFQFIFRLGNFQVPFNITLDTGKFLFFENKITIAPSVLESHLITKKRLTM